MERSRAEKGSPFCGATSCPQRPPWCDGRERDVRVQEFGWKRAVTMVLPSLVGSTS
jgi:hypothetical protein